MASQQTPDYAHVYNYPDVYEPAEDTFLLMDALEKEQNEITKLDPKICLEIGCGSGLVSVFLSKLLTDKPFILCTDINPSACLCAKETAQKNNVLNLNIVNTSLVCGLLPRISHKVDVIVFNPPYVVTPSSEIKDSGIAQSWAGGDSGREVMDKFFQLIPKLLSPNGVFYLLLEKQNDPKNVIKLFSEMYFSCAIIANRRAGPEVLCILKIVRNH